MAWKTDFRMKDLLTHEDVSPDEAKRVAGLVKGRLRRSVAFPGYVQHALMGSFGTVRDQDTFNESMDDLYDAADFHRVWVK